MQPTTRSDNNPKKDELKPHYLELIGENELLNSVELVKNERKAAITNEVQSLQHIKSSNEEIRPKPKNSILKSGGSGGSRRMDSSSGGSFLDPNSLNSFKKKTSFKDKLVEIREVESWKEFNYENSYSVDSKCRCECLLI